MIAAMRLNGAVRQWVERRGAAEVSGSSTGCAKRGNGSFGGGLRCCTGLEGEYRGGRDGIDSSRLENVQKNLPRFSWTITAVYITSLLIHQSGLVSDIQDHQMGSALMCQNTISPPVDQNHHQPGLVPEFE
ncbi:hypothetical protein M0R45_012018 [Rubus argutus]|uniref:Uncharacterized protein n=1 Tax=Rubus argutus TaxID=59490 RepID=A0AAW1YG46_RUBAR